MREILYLKVVASMINDVYKRHFWEVVCFVVKTFLFSVFYDSHYSNNSYKYTPIYV